MDLKVTNIVKFRDGGKGVVVGWKENEPVYIVGARFTNPIKKWNTEGRFNNKPEPTKYDIVAVHDGSSLNNPIEAFKASIKFENLPLLWAEKI